MSDKVQITREDCDFAAGVLGVIADQWAESALYYERAAAGGDETETYKTKREHAVRANEQIQAVVNRLNEAKDTP